MMTPSQSEHRNESVECPDRNGTSLSLTPPNAQGMSWKEEEERFESQRLLKQYLLDIAGPLDMHL